MSDSVANQNVDQLLPRRRSARSLARMRPIRKTDNS